MYARAVKLDKKKWSAQWKKTPYVRHGERKPVRPSRAKWSCSAKQLMGMSEKSLITKLTKNVFLKDWTQHKCPHCGKGAVKQLEQRGCGTWSYRCRAKKCHKFILPHACHPIFSTAWGKDYTSLKDQVMILFSLVVGVTTAQNHLLWGENHDFISTLSKRLDLARQKICHPSREAYPFW